MSAQKISVPLFLIIKNELFNFQICCRIWKKIRNVFFFRKLLPSISVILKVGGLHQKLCYYTFLSALKCLHFKNKLVQPF